MKQLKQFSVVASGLIAFAASAMASPPESAEALMSGGTPPAPQKVTAQTVQPSYTKALKGEKLSSERPNASRKGTCLPAKRAGAVTVSSLAGQGVMTFSALTANLGDDGTSCSVQTIEGTDSIAIVNFWQPGITVKGKVNPSDGSVTIAPQYLYTHETYGPMWLALCKSDGKPDYNASLTGQADNSGSISVASWWGIYVKEGTQAGSYMYVGYDALIQRANSTMKCTEDITGNVTSYNVLVSQPQMNTVRVVNFGNHGQTVDIDLNDNLGGTIPQQTVWNYPQNADFVSYTYDTYTNNNGSINITGLGGTIPLDKATSATVRKLSWKKWTAISRGTKTLLLGAWQSGEIECGIDITFPQFSVTELQGDGSEANPYQLSTLADLVLLSRKVAEYNETEGGTIYMKPFKGKHFKLMNDIDMGSYRFTPIGHDGIRIFAGNLDGNGKTISNLTVKDMANGYCGLFGRVDSLTVFKDITMVNPDVVGAGMWVGSLVGYSMGTLENINITGGSVINYGSATGGLSGSAYMVKNCHVDGTGVMGLAGWVGGLSGEVYVSIENSDVVNSKVMGAPSTGYSLGGVCGSIYGKGTDLYFMGQVDGMTLRANDGVGVKAGGVVGDLAGGTLSDSFAVGSVTGYGSYSNAGGVAGQVMAGSIDNCYFRGSVFTNFSRKTGGLVGYVPNKRMNGSPAVSSFTNLYVAATVRGEDYQYNKETGTIETLGTVEENAIAKAENIYFDRQVYNHNSVKYTALSTAEMTSANGLTGFPADKWLFTKDQYPRLKKFATTQAAYMSASAILFNQTGSVAKVNENVQLTPMGNTEFFLYNNGELSKQGHFSSIEGNTLKIKEEFGTDTLFFVNGKSNFYYNINVAPVPFEGFGSEESPYLIKTKSDLEALSQMTTVNLQYFPGTYFRQTNDIDLEYSENFIGICTDANLAANKFAGIYDGGGFTIHRMKIRGLVWKVAPSESNNWLGTPSTSGTEKSVGYKGFIGRLDIDGVLRNLNFAADCDATTEVWATAGLAVGDNNGRIENVRNYADIKGVSCWIGGITGMNEKTGVIVDCYNAGNVASSYNTAGGIAGKNDGEIENCANAGDVSVYRFANFGTIGKYNLAGGIAPTMSAGMVKNVLNVGTVSAETSSGGIIGNLNKATGSNLVHTNDVIGAVNYGTVRADNKASIGAIGGLNTTVSGVVPTVGTVLAYYDSQIVPYGAIGNMPAEGANPMTTEALISGTPLQGLDAEVWQFDKGMYPVLQKFADEPKLQAARKMTVIMPENITLGDLSTDASLASGFDWTLDNNSYFSISGSTLKTGAVPTQVINAVLTGSSAAYTRPFDLRRTPPVPLAGDGTEVSPYLISSASDWNNLADYINSVSNGFEGKFLKLTADISFDNNFQPLFIKDVDYLLGTLDGDGHTVSGVSMTTTDRYQGPVSKIGTTGVMKNITFEGDFSSKFAYTGGVTGKVFGRLSNVTSKVNVTISTGSGVSAFGSLYTGAVLEDVVNKGTITGPSTYIAGIAADAQPGVTFTRCGNEGHIVSVYKGTSTSTAQSIGGIVGATGPNVFTGCYNKGTIGLLTPATSYGVGGLIGTANSDAGIPEGLRMTDCYNEADITAGWLIGGLVANVNASVAVPNPIVLTNCYNTGDLTSMATTSKTSTSVAGLIALFSPGTKVTGCWNSGNITQGAKSTYAAGLVGYYKVAPTKDQPMTISDCYNTGTINAVGNQGAGIIAYIHNYTTVSDCYNSGTITGGFGLGGIAANLGSASASILRCYNTGTISSAGNRAGGIFGWNGTKALVQDCFNAGRVEITIDPVKATNGNITNGYGAGGIGGSASATIERCYNIGTIAGKCQVGGLVGVPSKGATNFKSCYNTGMLEAPVDTCGSIVGISMTDNGKYWNDDNKVTDCYYIGRNLANDIAGTAVSETELAALKMGEGWNNGDDYTYPLLAALAPDTAKIEAARVILSEADAKTGVVTDTFHVGRPEGLIWTSSVPALAFNECDAVWKETYKGDLTLTAKCGDASRDVALKADVEVVGVDDVTTSRIIDSQTIYTPAGVRISRSECVPGSVYIVVTVYDDGTRQTERMIF